MQNVAHAHQSALMRVRIPFSFALPVFFTGMAIGLIGLDFTFTHTIFLPEYGSEVRFFQLIFSVMTLLGGVLTLVWGVRLIQRPPVLEMLPLGLNLYNAWGNNPIHFPYEALESVQVIRFRASGKSGDEDVFTERWLVLQFSPHAQISARIPIRFGLQYEHYCLRIAGYLMNKPIGEVAAFLSALPGIKTTIIDKE